MELSIDYQRIDLAGLETKSFLSALKYLLKWRRAFDNEIYSNVQKDPKQNQNNAMGPQAGLEFGT